MGFSVFVVHYDLMVDERKRGLDKRLPITAVKMSDSFIESDHHSAEPIHKHFTKRTKTFLAGRY